MTIITNCKTQNCDIYCGRGSVFGNYYIIGRDGDRTEVIEKYRKYFYERILTDAKFRDKVLSLKGKRLGCWCVPEHRCHVEIIVEYLETVIDNR